MPLYTFRERRNRRLRHLFADSATEALDALTIYPWAFTLLDIRNIGQRPPVTEAECIAPDPAIVEELARHSGIAYGRALERSRT